MKKIGILVFLLAVMVALATAAPLVAFSPEAPLSVAIEAAIGTPEMYASVITLPKVEAVVAPSALGTSNVDTIAERYTNTEPMLAGLMRGVVSTYYIETIVEEYCVAPRGFANGLDGGRRWV